MGLVQYISNVVQAVTNRARLEPGQPVSSDGAWFAGAGIETKAGERVTADTAIESTAVLAALQRISWDLARAPRKIYRRVSQDERQPADDLPLYRIIHDEPNPEQEAISFWQRMQTAVLMHGNAYAWIERTRYGQPVHLWQLLNDQVSVERDPATNELAYLVNLDNQAFRLGSTDIFRISGFSCRGLLGMGQVMMGREAIARDLASGNYQSRFYKNGTIFTGLIELPMGKKVSIGDREEFSKVWHQLHTGENQHKVGILDDGKKWVQGASNPRDAEMMAGRTFNIHDICRIFLLPPHLLAEMGRATWSNVRELGVEYKTLTLGPWGTLHDQSMNRQLLMPGQKGTYYCELDFDAFLRGDLKSQLDAFSLAIQAGIYSPNECRVKLNMNPYEGGDDHLRPVNLAPAGQAPDPGLDTQNQADEEENPDEQGCARRMTLNLNGKSRHS